MILLRAAVLALIPIAGLAETIRVATFNTELRRDGPGLLLRDIRRDDPQVTAVVDVIARAAPDILALQGIDWDQGGHTLAALAGRLTEAGVDYRHRLALRPNSGMASGLDLDGDGYVGGPGDSHGYGEFTGQGGIAVLSRYPIDMGRVRDFSALLWVDLPDATLPETDEGPFPSAPAQAAQRLSSTGHWVVPVTLGDRTLRVLTFQAGPPVFDGPEDRNGLRNSDEIRFWQVLLDGGLGAVPPAPFVLAGGANLDPHDSDGRRQTIRDLLADPRFQDPRPGSDGAAEAPDQGHRGENRLDTVDWAGGPGRMRVDYLLPSADMTVAGAGVFWPRPGEPGHEAASGASRHRLVWVDLRLD